MIVYGCSQGDYSDYHLVSVFTTQELAEAFIARSKEHDRYSDWHDVEIIEVLDALPTSEVVWHASWNNNQRNSWGPNYVNDLNIWSEVRWGEEPVKFSFHAWGEEEGSRVSGFIATGTDREQVVKSVADRKAKWQSEELERLRLRDAISSAVDPVEEAAIQAGLLPRKN